MTEIAERPIDMSSSETEMGRVSHWINGRIVEGTSGRSGPVYDPATGRQAKQVDFASAEEVDAAVAAADGGLPGLARDLALASGRRSCSASATWSISTARRSRRS